MIDTRAARAEALFASPLQGSQIPTVDQVRAAIADMLARLGPAGCAARMAEEYGEHPTEAVRRMLWVLGALPAAFPDDVPSR
jgi:hypothetical protein